MRLAARSAPFDERRFASKSCPKAWEKSNAEATSSARTHTQARQPASLQHFAPAIDVPQGWRWRWLSSLDSIRDKNPPRVAAAWRSPWPRLNNVSVTLYRRERARRSSAARRVARFAAAEPNCASPRMRALSMAWPVRFVSTRVAESRCGRQPLTESPRRRDTLVPQPEIAARNVNRPCSLFRVFRREKFFAPLDGLFHSLRAFVPVGGADLAVSLEELQ